MLLPIDPVTLDGASPAEFDFGYLPDTSAAITDLADGFDRVLVVGGALDTIYDSGITARVLITTQPAEIPLGTYWFRGIAEPLLLVVDDGQGFGGSATLKGPADGVDPDDPLMIALEWAEDYWTRAAAVPDPLFAPNQPAILSNRNLDVLIRSRRFSSKQWSYRVVVSGAMQNVLESALSPVPTLDDPAGWVTGSAAPVDRFSATLTRAKLRGRYANTVFSFRATRTTFRAYQFKPVLSLLRTGTARILIADEVGLGKTIEAGLVWTELEARHDADRVLIVCPSNLVAKWRDEMEQRFGFEMQVLNRQTLPEFLERYREGRLPRRGAYIGSLETLRSWAGFEELDEAPPEFDLLIVDEAHQMRNADTKSFELGVRLASWSDSAVFLSATPINLGQSDLLNLLDLLAPGEFDSLEDLQLRLEPNAALHQVSRLIQDPRRSVASRVAALDSVRSARLGAALAQRPAFHALRRMLHRKWLTPREVVEARALLAELNALSTIITRTRKAEIDEAKPVRDPKIREVVWSPPEAHFYDEYLKWCRRRADVAGQAMYFAMQMPIRLASACLPAARDLVLRHGTITDEETGSESTSSTGWVDPHLELVQAARALVGTRDSKLEILRPLLAGLVDEGRRALLFTFSRPTLDYLRSTFEQEYRVAVLHGSVPIERRRVIMAEFREGRYDFVFANRVASEGLDFEFCSAVINYDLPWNPMEIEQRIGRIDRIGQTEEKIVVAHFYNDATIDERILRRVLDRIGIFEESIGALEPIIAQHQTALQETFDFTLSDEERELKLNQVLTAIEAQKASVDEFATQESGLLVSQDVDVAGLERDLERTGSYFGQLELANLLSDWAGIDGAQGLRWSAGAPAVELRGNAAMADRLAATSAREQQRSAEVRDLQNALRSEMPISLLLDQEAARTAGGDLLTARHPLVRAALDVPDHKHARFARVQMGQSGAATAGRYVLVLAEARQPGQNRSEVWTEAVSMDGRAADQAVGEAFLASLAAGSLRESSTEDGGEDLVRLAERATRLLENRHERDQERANEDAEAMRSARRAALEGQHERRMRTIEKRTQTAVERRRGIKAMRLFDAQRVKQEQLHARLLGEVDRQSDPTIELSFLAVCDLEVTSRG